MGPRRAFGCVVITGLVLTVGACRADSYELQVSDAELSTQVLTWPNFTGLPQVDPGIWRERLERACLAGVSDHDVARSLAAEFFAEDSLLGRPPDAAPPREDEAAAALWLIARNTCPEQFSDEDISRGPPFP